jgi:hypothetical protein
MKQVIIIILMLVYGVSSSGMTINLHFCCGKLDDISFSAHTKDCPMGSTQKKSNCCDNKQIVAKLNADQQVFLKYIKTSQSSTVDVDLTLHSSLFPAEMALIKQPAPGQPLPHTSVPLFIKNCVFRI